MNGESVSEELPALASLLLVYAPAGARPWHRLCWQLDQRLGAVIRRAGDPMIAAIRLAWWHDVLVAGDPAKGGGEPLVEAWRGIAPPSTAPAAEALIDGWRMLLGEEPPTPEELGEHGLGRGGGLFALLAGETAPAGLAPAGAVWALWDLAGHTQDHRLAEQAIAQARRMAADAGAPPRGAAFKPLRLLHDLAAADARAARIPAGGFSGRHYRRLLWRGLFG
jgi:phytoene synthase